jgi:hypothetical protein
MNKFIAALRHPQVWAVSVQLLILYCVAVGLFYFVDWGNRSAAASLKAGVAQNKASSQFFVFLTSAAANTLGVVTFVFLSRRLDTVPRQAMIAVPFLLLVEKHFRAVRAAPQTKRMELLLAAGMTAGLLAGVLVLMRDCPVK